MREDNNKRRTILILSVVVVILALAIVYFAALKPAMIKHDNKVYIQGGNSVMNSILSSIQSNGYVQIPLANNKTLVLIPYAPNSTAANGSGSVNGTA